MKFKKIFLITLLLLVIFTISSISANENVTDITTTQQIDNEIITTAVEPENTLQVYEANNNTSSSNLIGKTKEDLLSGEYKISIYGPDSIEKGETVTFTIKENSGPRGDGINISLTNLKGESHLYYSNYYFPIMERQIKIDTSNLNAGQYYFDIKASNPNDTVFYVPKYLEITDSKTYGSYSVLNVKTINYIHILQYYDTENVKIDLGLIDNNNNPIFGYIDIFVDGKYNKRMNINHEKETLNLGKFSVGKHTIRFFFRYNYNSYYNFTVIKGPTSKSTIKTTSVNAPSVTAYYKTSKYFKVTIKKNGKAVKNLKLKLKVYTGKKTKIYTVKTNSKGVASFKTNKLSIGTHKVVVSSTNKNYKVSKTSKIIIKKKSNTRTVSKGNFKAAISEKLWKEAKRSPGMWDKQVQNTGIKKYNGKTVKAFIFTYGNKLGVYWFDGTKQVAKKYVGTTTVKI